MSFISKAIGHITGASEQIKGAQNAANTQAAAAQQGISQIASSNDLAQQFLQSMSNMGADELRAAFGISKDALTNAGATVTGLAQPLIDAGTSSLGQQLALSGGSGPDAQRAAIAAIQASPEFTALTRQGEDAILANASATGGLRGGNAQAALAQFRPAALSSLINQQYERLGGLTGLGANARQLAAGGALQTGQGIAQGALQTGQGIAGNALQTGISGAGLSANSAQIIAQLLGQQGAATAGGQIAQGGLARTGFSDLLQIAPSVLKAFGIGGK